MAPFHFYTPRSSHWPNNTINTTVYRKPTQTDQYLHWDSNHFITAKHSVYNTLAHWAKVVSSNPTVLSKELDHIRRALQSCLFPVWALNRLQHNFEHKHNNNNRDPNPTDTNNHNTNSTTEYIKQRNISMFGSIYTQIGRKVHKDMQQTGPTGTLQKVPTPSSHFSWHQRTRTINSRKVGSFTSTSAHISTV